MFAAALAAAGAPVSSSFIAGAAVPPPPAVEASRLQAAEPVRAVVDRIVRVRGRQLNLSLVRSGSAGMAVLSVPGKSSVPSLPEIPAAEFLDLVTNATGCRPDGEVRKVASHRGTIAISAGLDCAAAGS